MPLELLVALVSPAFFEYSVSSCKILTLEKFLYIYFSLFPYFFNQAISIFCKDRMQIIKNVSIYRFLKI
jgi:hypothetical protein